MLTGWWTRLEASPRLSGPRRHLRELLGETTVDFLEQVGILRHDGIAQSYPCPAPGGDRCPRVVIEVGGTYCAVCGNRPIECDDVVLTAGDAALLTADLVRLCKAVAKPLGIRGSPETIPDLADVARVGAVIPEPGMNYPVFLVIRQTFQSYCEAVGALAARNHGSPFGVLVPTDRFVTDCVERLCHDVRATIVPLESAISIVDDRLVAEPAARRLLAQIGVEPPRRGIGADRTIVARALICDGASKAEWRSLDDDQYQQLVDSSGEYMIFADQRQRQVTKHGTAQKVRYTHFDSIFCALNRRGQYRPEVHSPDMTSAKETFQRARQAFDPGSGKTGWRLFKTSRDDENRAIYLFEPDPGVSFAFVFLPGG